MKEKISQGKYDEVNRKETGKACTKYSLIAQLFELSITIQHIG
ncbi:hypothetical protein PRUB_a1950 [Pseudoalteromonas rubra]|uniref:Uncharacterized protein n=1 Tax=Pseudoalteromonas rubra TaxID=43658 RepID=A0A8T0CGL0_9GAMM|nr:hypothetical protein PRUB_a1950 [Pseudoalteromonas rubra]